MTPVVQLHVSPGHFLHMSGRELRNEPTRSQFEDFSETAAALETTERHLTRARSGESPMARSSTRTLDDTQRLQIELEGLMWFNFGEAQWPKTTCTQGVRAMDQLHEVGSERPEKEETDKDKTQNIPAIAAHRRRYCVSWRRSQPKNGSNLGVY